MPSLQSAPRRVVVVLRGPADGTPPSQLVLTTDLWIGHDWRLLEGVTAPGVGVPGVPVVVEVDVEPQCWPEVARLYRRTHGRYELWVEEVGIPNAVSLMCDAVDDLGSAHIKGASLADSLHDFGGAGTRYRIVDRHAPERGTA